MGRIRAFVIVASLFSMTAVAAQNDKEAEPSHLGENGSFGVTGGAFSGTGLSYRQFFDDTWGGQIAGFVWSTSSIFFGDLGVNAFYTLHQKPKMRFYLPMGLGVYRSVNNSTRNASTTTFIGMGYGMMFDIGKSLYFALDLPICIRLNGSSYGGIIPIPSLSLLYAF